MSRKTYRKVVLFMDQPYSKRNHERFGVPVFLRQGFEVEVFDFTPWLWPAVEKATILSDPVEFTGLRRFTSRAAALCAIAAIDKRALVILMMLPDPATLPICEAVSRQGLDYAVFMANPVPEPPAPKSVPARLLSHQRRFLREGPAFLLDALRCRVRRNALRRRVRRLKPAKFFLLGGLRALDHYGVRCPSDDDTTLLWLHSLDYDTYLFEQQRPSAADDNAGRIVFFDGNDVFATDYIYCGRTSPLTEQEYFPKVVGFLEHLERLLGCETVIALHPRSNYGAERFGGRTAMKNQTCRLVRSAKLVVTHGSTAVNFAVICGKPLLFITLNGLETSEDGPVYAAQAQALGRQMLSLDRPLPAALSAAEALRVDAEAYARYMHEYIKAPQSGSNEPFWDTVIRTLRDGVAAGAAHAMRTAGKVPS